MIFCNPFWQPLRILPVISRTRSGLTSLYSIKVCKFPKIWRLFDIFLGRAALKQNWKNLKKVPLTYSPTHYILLHILLILFMRRNFCHRQIWSLYNVNVHYIFPRIVIHHTANSSHPYFSKNMKSAKKIVQKYWYSTK